MKFTPYIWDLYKQSEEGKQTIAMFTRQNIEELSRHFGFAYIFTPLKKDIEQLGALKKGHNFYRQLYDYAVQRSLNNQEEARNLFNKIVIQGEFTFYFLIKDSHKKIILPFKKTNYQVFFQIIETISTALHHAHPEFFLPYFFNRLTFYQFTQICQQFSIPLPAYPGRHDYEARASYYLELCETLQEFRRHQGIGALEFPAFLYDFGIKALPISSEKNMPKASRVWFLGSGKHDFPMLDQATGETQVTYGAGNADIKTGDIMVIYCLSPRKSIHSIWRATGEAFINPFSYYYFAVPVGHPIHVKPVTYAELKSNPILSQNSTVRGKMQGLNGRAIQQKEYQELLRLLEEKGTDISQLPRLPYYKNNEVPIENERDVEERLLEPLLKRIGFDEKNWLRQMPIRMGRGVRYYPDYALKANSKPGSEQAAHIVEAKYSIASETQLKEAFLQAKSYAIRLQATTMMLADRDFIWMFPRKRGNFLFESHQKYPWGALTQPDTLFKLKQAMQNPV